MTEKNLYRICLYNDGFGQYPLHAYILTKMEQMNEWYGDAQIDAPPKGYKNLYIVIPFKNDAKLIATISMAIENKYIYDMLYDVKYHTMPNFREKYIQENKDIILKSNICMIVYDDLKIKLLAY